MKTNIIRVSFALWALAGLGLLQAQTFYTLEDLNVLTQTSSATPTSYSGTYPGTEDTGPYSFEIQGADDSYPTVTGPSGTYTLTLNGSGKYVYDSTGYSSTTTLAAAFPFGNYTFNASTPETVNLSNSGFTSIPQVTSISGGSWSGGDIVVTAGSDLILTLSSYTGATFATNGVETFRLYGGTANEKTQSIGALGGSYFGSVDAGTLAPGTYTAFIEYENGTTILNPGSTTDYFAAGLSNQTYLTIVVNPAPEPGVVWMLLLGIGCLLLRGYVVPARTTSVR